MEYTKLSELVDSQFTIKEVKGYKFKRWNGEERRMEVSDNWQEGFRKLYQVVTDKGLLDLGSGQLGSLLETVFYQGKSDLINRGFSVGSNGKTGKDIRYYFKPVKQAEKSSDNEFNLEDIPY